MGHYLARRLLIAIPSLLGISVVRDDDPAAVVRAILDAVNRRLQRLLGSERAR